MAGVAGLGKGTHMQFTISHHLAGYVTFEHDECVALCGDPNKIIIAGPRCRYLMNRQDYEDMLAGYQQVPEPRYRAKLIADLERDYALSRGIQECHGLKESVWTEFVGYFNGRQPFYSSTFELQLGMEEGRDIITCPTCRGRKRQRAYIQENREVGIPEQVIDHACDECGGTGQVVDYEEGVSLV
jgi:hypothetical protein